MPSDVEILQELNRGYVRSAETSDVRWYADHLAEDFLATNPDGSIVDRAAFLARMARPYPGKDLEAVDVRIRILGDVAMIHAGFRDRRPDGEAGLGQYTDIWARRGGRWLCVAAHFTRMPAAAAPATPSEVEILRALNRDYIRSVQESDVRWFDAHLSDDFVNGNPDGSLVDRAGFLGQIAPPCPVSNLREEDVMIRMLGDTALIHARTVSTKPDGQPGRGRYTDVWARRAGRWRCVSAHVTRG